MRNILKCYASDFGDGLQLILLLRILCNLRARTGSDRWARGSRGLSLVQDFQMLCVCCVDSGVSCGSDSGFLGTSLGYRTDLPFQNVKALIDQIDPEVSYSVKTRH